MRQALARWLYALSCRIATGHWPSHWARIQLEQQRRAEIAVRELFAQAKRDGWQPDVELPRFTGHKMDDKLN